jgi:hypothetical protein
VTVVVVDSAVIVVAVEASHRAEAVEALATVEDEVDLVTVADAADLATAVVEVVEGVHRAAVVRLVEAVEVRVAVPKSSSSPIVTPVSLLPAARKTSWLPRT